MNDGGGPERMLGTWADMTTEARLTLILLGFIAVIAYLEWSEDGDRRRLGEEANKVQTERNKMHAEELRLLQDRNDYLRTLTQEVLERDN